MYGQTRTRSEIGKRERYRSNLVASMQRLRPALRK